MAKRQALEDQLARLRELGRQAPTDDLVEELRAAISGRSNILCGKACNMAGSMGICGLAPDIVSAFERFMRNPVKTDPGCRAKFAAVEALCLLDHGDAGLFLRGARHVQKEPSFGPPVDTADRLRGRSAFGLYQVGHPELLYELVNLLLDPEIVARRAAVHVLSEVAGETAELLLRMKMLQRDTEWEVMSDCFAALIKMAPVRSIPLVARYLDDGDGRIAEEAAMALGESRQTEAAELLIERWDGSVDPEFRRMLLPAVGMTRCDGAFDFLLTVVTQEHEDYACSALKALRLCANGEERRGRVACAAQERGETSVSAAYSEVFEDTAGVGANGAQP